MFVTEPAAHSVHDATSDAAEYLPAPHAVHVVAPASAPVSVIEPAWHPSQYVRPALVVYIPAAHLMHACSASDPPVTSPY